MEFTGAIIDLYVEDSVEVPYKDFYVEYNKMPIKNLYQEIQ